MNLKKCVIALVASLAMMFVGCTKKQNASERVLNLVSTAEIKGFDPINAGDLYSGREISKIYEGLLEFHYLKSPYTLVPNLAEEMPQVSADGLVYTFKIRPGVMFQDDVAFAGGKGRELEAKDFVYSVKRLADSKLNSEGWWVLDGKVKGLNEWRDKNSKLPATNYDEEVEGLKAVDKYTLQFTLAKPFPQFLYSLAMPFTYAVSREVAEKYGKEFLNHPVGTGPYKLEAGKFDQTKTIIYVKNPTFRKKLYPSDASPEFQNFLADKEKPLPLVDKVVVHVMVESQPAWLKFNKGEIDFYGIPKDNFGTAIKDNQLSPELSNKGLILSITPLLDVTYTGFNYENKLFHNVNLRRAMYLAYDEGKSNELFYNKTSFPAQSIVPPGIVGHVADYKNPWKGPKLDEAKKLLAEAGYPEGKGLPEITYDISDSTTSRQMAEFFVKQMEQIGVKIKIVASPWPEFMAKVKKKSVQMFGMAWGADYPDAENFLQLLYGPNKSPGANSSNYDNPEYNKMFEKAALMQDSPERTKLYEDLYKYVADNVVLMYNMHRQSYTLRQSWLRNYHTSDLHHNNVQYLNIDNDVKAEALKKF